MKFLSLLFAASTTFAFQDFAVAEETEAPTASKQAAASEEKAENDNWESDKRLAALRVQLFLDSKGFGPGKMDGRWGGFSEKAAQRWNAAKKDQAIAILEDGSLDIVKAKEIPYDSELFTTYKITEEDSDALGALPETPEEKAKLEHLPHSTLMELVSEKFHADPDFIVEVNGLEAGDDLAVGDEVKVPAVAEPFEIKEPVGLAEASKEKKEKKEGRARRPGQW